MVSLGAQTGNSFSAHPLMLGRSQRAVGFIRPGPCFGSMSRLGLAELSFTPPLDFIWIMDGVVLGEETYGDAMGIG
jgi:hypothetical protein